MSMQSIPKNTAFSQACQVLLMISKTKHINIPFKRLGEQSEHVLGPLSLEHANQNRGALLHFSEGSKTSQLHGNRFNVNTL